MTHRLELIQRKAKTSKQYVGDTDSPEMLVRAYALFPGNAVQRHLWIEAVRFLRTTRHGWQLDRAA